MTYPVKAVELQQVPAFREMTDVQLDGLASIMLRQVYSPGQVIFMEGDQSESLWFVYEGRVKIIKQSLSGRIQGLCLMNRGKCFGSCPLFDMETNPATAQALDTCTLFILPKDSLQQLRQREPHLVRALLHIYSQRLEHLSHVSEVLGVWTVSDRINDCLLRYANPVTEPSVVELTHERVAALSGTVREIVTRHLLELEKVGAIRSEMGRIIILNSAALHKPCACDRQTSSV